MVENTKIRAWDKKDREYMKVHTIHFGTKKVIVTAPRYGNTSMLFEEVELEEYIGIKDKYDEDLFEGDIVLFENWDPKVIERGTNGFLGFGLKGTDKLLMSTDSNSLRKIGTLKENPWLIKD